MKKHHLWIALLFLSALCPQLRADLIYSNLANSQGIFVTGNTHWDDATIVGGGVLSEFRYEAYNAEAGDPRALTTTVSLHLFDRINNLPNGQFLGSFTMTTQPISAGSSAIATRSGLESLDIDLPISARLGVRFDFTANSGIIVHGTPTLGFTTDTKWTGVPPIADSPREPGSLGFSISAVPEPSSFALAAVMLSGCLLHRGRMSTKSTRRE